jgi:hypothetical protein
MPGQGRKRAGDDVAPVIEGEIVPATLEELDDPTGREGDDELDDDDAVELAEADEDDEDEDDEDEDDEDEDEDEDDEEDKDDDEEEEADAEAEADVEDDKDDEADEADDDADDEEAFFCFFWEEGGEVPKTLGQCATPTETLAPSVVM